MAIRATDALLPSPATKIRPGSDNLEAEAIGLEVPVLIHGSQVTAVVMETTEHAEPFEEETSTMIVFPRGAVIKLLARVRTGHTLVLTNLRTRQDAICKVIQVNGANSNSVHYVKLEFVQSAPGFWGVHFPSDPLPSARPQEKTTPAPAAPKISEPPATPAMPAIPKSRSHDTRASIIAVESTEPAPLLHAPLEPLSSLVKEPTVEPPAAFTPPAPPKISAPAASNAAPAAPRTKPQLPEMTFPSSIAPTPGQNDAAKIDLKEIPSSPKPEGYGLSRNWQREAIEPLAGPAAASPMVDSTASLKESAVSSETKPVVTEKIPRPAKRPDISRRKESKSENRAPKQDRPVFGSLHTFANVAPAQSEIASLPALPAELISRPSRSHFKFGYLLAAVCILAIAAAGAMYVRRNPSALARFTSNAQNPPAPAANVPSAMNPLQASNPAPNISSTPTESASTAPADDSATAETNPPTTPETSSATSAEVPPARVATPKKESVSKARLETTPRESADAAKSKASASDDIANIYSGDLNAKPQIKPRKARRVDAPLPNIAAAAPSGETPSQDSAGLGSILSGADASLAAPSAPANPTDAVRQGGLLVQPKLISSVPPVYPQLARQANVEGEVVIEAQIGISGIVTSMRVISGPSLLRSAATDALRKWRYTPAKLDGKPIAQKYNVTIRFRLNH